MKALGRLAERRYVPQGGYSSEQARELAALSRLLSRQIGLVLDRHGRVGNIIVGDLHSILIPELPHARTGAGRLRGLRLLHTHLVPEGLSREDLMDLVFLRLDSVSVLTVDEWGQPRMFQSAHLMPPGPGQDDSGVCTEPAVPWDRVTTNFTTQAEALEEEFGRVLEAAVRTDGGEEHARAVLVSVSPEPRAVQEQHLAELADLAATAGIAVTGSMVQRVAAIHPRHILGRSKLAELEVMALQGQASLIVFDGELSPAQLSSLTERTERRVMDRTQLILDIFARHAVSRAGKLQVEMAQLQYALPRLVGRHRSLDRLTGGIFGNKGSGETKLELERRRVRERITRIRRDLEDLRRQRFHTRVRRARQDLPIASLVGYTNAGKSTLFNALTHANVPAENKLFATLDPTTRRLRFPRDRELVLADTVGFIRNLPRELAEAFRATLEELDAADLLVHVVDASHPERERQMEAVESTLAEMNLQGVPRIMLLNKWDLVPVDARLDLLSARTGAIPVSACTGMGLDAVALAIEKALFVDGIWQKNKPQTWQRSAESSRGRRRNVSGKNGIA